MKIYISADMEGVTGVVSWENVSAGENHGNGGYERFRRLMTGQVNAAILGALEAGAKEVTVNDSHAKMNNLILEDLHPEARLISGSPKPMWGMGQGIDGSFDAAFLLGYHARAGTPGVLSHTCTSSVLEFRVNGLLLGEIGLNAALAGFHGVPVALVAGDSSAAKEARDLLGHLGPVRTLAVKDHISRFVADSMHPEKVCRLMQETARQATKEAGSIKPFVIDGPIRIEMKMADPGQADAAGIMPGVLRLDGTTVTYEAPDYPTALKGAEAMMTLASVE